MSGGMVFHLEFAHDPFGPPEVIVSGCGGGGGRRGGPGARGHRAPADVGVAHGRAAPPLALEA